jgi:hypothetical protein
MLLLACPHNPDGPTLMEDARPRIWGCNSSCLRWRCQTCHHGVRDNERGATATMEREDTRQCQRQLFEHKPVPSHYVTTHLGIPQCGGQCRARPLGTSPATGPLMPGKVAGGAVPFGGGGTIAPMSTLLRHSEGVMKYPETLLACPRQHRPCQPSSIL